MLSHRFMDPSSIDADGRDAGDGTAREGAILLGLDAAQLLLWQRVLGSERIACQAELHIVASTQIGAERMTNVQAQDRKS